MKQLTLDKAATEYSLNCFVNNPDIPIKSVFQDGATWQKEQYKPFIDLYNAIDSCIELTPELLMKCKLLIELNKL